MKTCSFLSTVAVSALLLVGPALCYDEGSDGAMDLFGDSAANSVPRLGRRADAAFGDRFNFRFGSAADQLRTGEAGFRFNGEDGGRAMLKRIGKADLDVIGNKDAKLDDDDLKDFLYADNFWRDYVGSRKKPKQQEPSALPEEAYSTPLQKFLARSRAPAEPKMEYVVNIPKVSRFRPMLRANF